MPAVEVNGVSLYYEIAGHGPPLVLAHGFACGLRMWDPQVNYSLAERLRGLSVPTLLIVGEHDEPCVRVHRFMADTIPGARHVLIPGVGHLTNLEAPEAFNRAVAKFLGAATHRAIRATAGRAPRPKARARLSR